MEFHDWNIFYYLDQVFDCLDSCEIAVKYSFGFLSLVMNLIALFEHGCLFYFAVVDLVCAAVK